MPAVFSALMCHAPIVVPGIGGARAEACAQSTAAMRAAARRLYQCAPDVVVVLSPHTPRATDAFSVVASDRHGRIRGDFGNFGAPKLAVDVAASSPARERVFAAARAAGVPVEALTPRTLDHGALVPLWFLAEAGWRGPTVVIGLPASAATLQGARAMNHALGRALAKAAGDERWAIVASGDCSHRLIPGAPSGFDERAKHFDAALQRAVASGDDRSVSAIDDALRALAAEDVVDTVEIAAASTAFVAQGRDVLSYEGPFGVGYLVAVLHDAAARDVARADGARADGARTDVARADVARADGARADGARADVARADVARADVARADVARADVARADVARADGAQDGAQDGARDGARDVARDGARDGVQDGAQDGVQDCAQDRAQDGAAVDAGARAAAAAGAHIGRDAGDDVLGGDALIDVANDALAAWHERRDRRSFDTSVVDAAPHAGVFVTWRTVRDARDGASGAVRGGAGRGDDGAGDGRHGDDDARLLRGCVGRMRVDGRVSDSVAELAVSAASTDPRFPPIAPSERVAAEVTLLAPSEPVQSVDELDVRVWGVEVRAGRRHGVLLPDIDGVDDVATQISVVLRKAGIAPHEAYELRKFRARKVKRARDGATTRDDGANGANGASGANGGRA